MANLLNSGILVILTISAISAQLTFQSGTCATSLQCAGASICYQQSCLCPPGCTVVGGVCTIVQTPYLMGMYGYGVYSGFGYNPVQNYGYFPNNMGLYGYPGQACSSGCNCLGGSYYVQGSCSCQVGYIISGQTCVPQPIVTQPAPISYSNCPTGFYFIGYTCAPYYIPQPQPQPQPQPVTYQCSTPCSGGAVCNYGSCSCPQSLVMYSGSCFTQQVYPGSACNPVQTCLGGSYCSYGSCACQSGYTVAGNSCVLVYQPAQYYTIPTQQISTYTSYTCTSSSQCGTGAICGFGACRCTSINYYYQTGVGCVFRRKV